MEVIRGKEIEETVEEMKLRDREEKGVGMVVKKYFFHNECANSSEPQCEHEFFS